MDHTVVTLQSTPYLPLPHSLPVYLLRNSQAELAWEVRLFNYTRRVAELATGDLIVLSDANLIDLL